MTVPETATERLPSVDPQTFRKVMGSFASGVTIVTTCDAEGRPRGFTCSAFCSVSADPPLLTSGVSSHSSTLRAIRECGRFAVNVLDSRGREVSQLFASRAVDKFARVRWRPGEASGMPLLHNTVAHAECELHEAVPAGDHTLLLGRVIGGGAEQDRLPLAYWRGGYARLL
ncbi:flavin reductase [Streptomyces sp. TRM43335]|uniref:Flavin reductase n=1 Tax=Streptomyces taklimakanensis TaxID=2569853 RepID=A0A6G2BGL5_9ACTN|nr:flavin reductase family protein [Streptomyces taklimakanensis]MTE21408.1 flavin reductase [Streptomyces taklimakanensis]